jgi:ubiquitin C-terminal hydrolase
VQQLLAAFPPSQVLLREIVLLVEAVLVEQLTRLVAMLSTAEAEAQEATTMTLVGLARLVVPVYSAEAVVVQDCATAEQQSEGLEEHGGHILLAAEEQVGKAT